MSALRSVLAAGRDLASPSATGLTGRLAASEEFSERLAATEAVALAAAAAGEAALGNEYAVRQRTDGSVIAGRRLSASSIRNTGLAAALLSGSPLEDDLVIKDLAGYLAGPEVPQFRLVGLDASLTLTTPVAIDDWELFVADQAQLTEMLPVPSLASFQPKRPWDPGRWAGLAFLRRPADREPVTGISFFFPEAYPEWELWRPLLVLALATPDVITMWTDHEVEPGRHVGTRLDRMRYRYHTWGPGADEAVELPDVATVNVEPSDEAAFRERIRQIASLLPPEPPPQAGKKDRHPGYTRLRLAALRLLAAGEHTAVIATPADPVRTADALLHYVVALEALFGQDSRDGEMTRRISQRAAVLVGRDDAERLAVAAEIKNVYEIRSRVVHGGAEPSERDLETLRSTVRRAILGRLVHGDPQGDDSLVAFCDRALLSSQALTKLRDPLRQYDDIVLPAATK